MVQSRSDETEGSVAQVEAGEAEEMSTPTCQPSDTHPDAGDVPAHPPLAINGCQKLVNPSISCNPLNNLVVDFIPILQMRHQGSARSGAWPRIMQLTLEPKPKYLFITPGCPTY